MILQRAPTLWIRSFKQVQCKSPRECFRENEACLNSQHYRLVSSRLCRCQCQRQSMLSTRGSLTRSGRSTRTVGAWATFDSHAAYEYHGWLKPMKEEKASQKAVGVQMVDAGCRRRSPRTLCGLDDQGTPKSVEGLHPKPGQALMHASKGGVEQLGWQPHGSAVVF